MEHLQTTGVRSIDAFHLRMESLHELITSLSADERNVMFDRSFINGVIKTIKEGFDSEKRIMASTNYDRSRGHLKDHSIFISKLEGLVISDKGLEDAVLVCQLINELVQVHFHQHDRPLLQYISVSGHSKSVRTRGPVSRIATALPVILILALIGGLAISICYDSSGGGAWNNYLHSSKGR